MQGNVKTGWEVTLILPGSLYHTPNQTLLLLIRLSAVQQASKVHRVFAENKHAVPTALGFVRIGGKDAADH